MGVCYIFILTLTLVHGFDDIVGQGELIILVS